MSDASLVGATLDGKFRIEREIASGASGDVYEAMHLVLGTPVAVKVLRPGIPETADIRRKRFLREARVAARIQSDHVVRVFDVVAPEVGPTYIVMELLQGETLADRVKRVGAIASSEAVDLVAQAARPLAELHDAGIVHRDVKPSNLFLARDADGRERIKLLDFGVAAFQRPVSPGESSLTLSEAIIGTPRYMAPEQVVSSRQVDARADVWALGVTLYELLSGKPPFDGQTVLAVLNQIEHQEPRPLAELCPQVPGAILSVVHACLAKDPAGRPADARALRESLLGAPDVAPTAFSSGAHVSRGRAAAVVGAVVTLGVLAAFGLRRSPPPPAALVAPPEVPTAAASVAAPSAVTQPPAEDSASASAPASASPPSAARAGTPPRHGGARPQRTPAPRAPSALRSPADDDRIE